MEELLEAYRRWRRAKTAWETSRGIEQSERDKRYAELSESEKTLVAAYEAAPVTLRERALVDGGMTATCCCNDGVTAAEVWCEVNWPEPEA